MTLVGGHDPILLLIEGAVIGFLIALPVGPAAILCIRRTVAAGLFAGGATGVGAALGDAIYGTIAAFGLTFVSEFIHRHELYIRAGGGLFLCVMGWTTLRHRPRSIGDPVALDREHRLATYLRYGASSFFITTFNPITIMAFGAVFAAQGLSDVGNDTMAALILVGGVGAGALAWWFLLCATALAFRRRFSEAGMVWLNRVSGAALLLFGVAALISLLPVDWQGLADRLRG
jgi:threonine/homoserine/homoserine lactone efflux protein